MPGFYEKLTAPITLTSSEVLTYRMTSNGDALGLIV
jgi:hypothetical protein